MTQITLNIPDNKLEFFLEVFQQFGLEVSDDAIVVPEWHKEEVRRRIKETNPEDYIPWEEARKQLKFKSI